MSLKPPKPLMVNNDLDMAQEWAEWIEEYEDFFIATKIGAEEEIVQIANFKTVIGREAVKVINNLSLTAEEKKKLKSIKEKLTEHFAPAKNKTYERCQFHRIKQQPNESFEDFLQKLRTQVKKCSYEINAVDEFVMDQIVLGINSDATRQKLWIEDELSLEKTKKICRAAERANKQISELNSDPNAPSVSVCVNAIETFDCKRCGNNHGIKSCPAFGKRCKSCGTKGHFEAMCRKNAKKSHKKDSEVKNKKSKSKKVHAVSESSDTSDDSSDSESSNCEEKYKFVGSIKTKRVNAVSNDKWCATVDIGGSQLNLKLDTGAECNVLSAKTANQLNVMIEKSSTKRLIAYNNETIKVIGESKVWCKSKNKECFVIFKIVRDDLQPILGRNMCEKMGFITRVNKVGEEIDKLGCCNTFEYDIDLIKNAQLKIMPLRRIAHALREKTKKELERMVKMGVIEPISEPTPAVSPMHIVTKGEKLRICMDPTELNKNIKRRHYPLKTVEEIAATTAGSNYFTKLDCQKGFWQIKVSERTSKYLTMATPWGRYRYLRLPFGISSAPEIFSEVMNRTLQGISNCEVAMDDIFLYAPTKEQLKKITERVIERLTNAGFTLNKEKCEFNKTSMKFLGHIFTDKGYKADNEKIEAINQLKPPKNIKELQRVLGMVNYLGKFICNLSELTDPLRSLLRKETEWSWNYEQQEAFNNIKRTLTTTPVLAYYDVNKMVKLSVDASQNAMGACLMQNNQPVAYATRAFTNSQKSQPQIVKEALAIRFGCSKFHQYVYGKELVIETDHKPLETIFKNPIQNAPLRLQRILFDVVQYAPKVQYIKGTSIPIADALSRDCETTEIEKEEEYAVNIILSIGDQLKERFIEATSNDNELKILKAVIMRGWPDDETTLPKTVRKYAPFKQEITFEDGLLFKGNKIIVPEREIKNMIEETHTGHAGITKSIQRARQTLYWYGQTNDIKNYVERCAVCQETQKSNQREPMIMRQVPDYPFQIVSSDIFTFRGEDFLLIADHYSGFMDFRKLQSSTSAEVILLLRQWFAVHGIPQIFESDGGPQYAAARFESFAKNWLFTHRISSPYYPRSNGFAERNVQTMKIILKRCYLDGTDPYAALLMLRNTPRNEVLKSPNQRLFSRCTRTPLPIDIEELKPKIVKGVTEELRELRLNQKRYVDRVATPTLPLKVGDKVRLKVANREWKGAEVVEETKYPRSVILETAEGRRYRRNTFHLHKTKANIRSNIDPLVETEDRVDNSTRTELTLRDETTRNEPIETTVELPNQQSADKSVQQPQHTRSGRLVKPIIRYDDEF